MTAVASDELQRQILDRIHTAGPLPFAAFMSIALYDPRYGYYARGEARTGWSGHFLTAPELDPAFGELWARAFRSVWDACGRPDDFEIVEIGPGEGGFAAAVLDAIDTDFQRAVTYRLVERAPNVTERQRARLGAHPNAVWTRSIAELPAIRHGCVFANEVLDNLPVHLIEFAEGRMWELCVGDDDGELAFVRRPPSNPEVGDWVERMGIVPKNGSIVEVTLAAESLVTHTTTRLQRGALFFVDYGAEATELARRGGTLVAYSSEGADADVLRRPGERDITAHANWTSVRGALERAGLTVRGPTTQRDFLRDLGVSEIDATLKSEHAAALAEQRGADAVRALSRRHALSALLDAHGLGGLQVLEARKGITATEP